MGTTFIDGSTGDISLRTIPFEVKEGKIIKAARDAVYHTDYWTPWETMVMKGSYYDLFEELPTELMAHQFLAETKVNLIWKTIRNLKIKRHFQA